MKLNFPLKWPSQSAVLTFDFAARLAGATITSIVSVTVTVEEGVDPTPMAILNGAAAISGTAVLQPVQGGVYGVRYLIVVIVNTSNVDLSPQLWGILPIGHTGLIFDPVSFRQKFPQFASVTAYPSAALQFAWDMGASWVSQRTPASWGLSAPKQQQAADLMGAVVTYQLYGPASGGSQSYSQAGEAPGAVTSATEGSISATFQLPEIGSSAFKSMLLASPPYGRMLLALLQIAASVGPYIPSCRPAWIPP